jgi:hypothetical protein
MGERLTPEWTETVEEAYGESGRIGYEGEKLAVEIIKSVLPRKYLFADPQITLYHSDRDMQNQGKDLSFCIGGRTFFVDVKTNLHHGKDVCIDIPTLRRSKADVWMHLNLEDPDDWVIYTVDSMLERIGSWQPRPLYWISREEAETLVDL